MERRCASHSLSHRGTSQSPPQLQPRPVPTPTLVFGSSRYRLIGNAAYAGRPQGLNCTGGPAELDGLVSLLRKALDRLKDKLVPDLEGPELYKAVSQSIQEIHGYASIRNANPDVFNNWCDMDLTEVDLGWGKPAWVSFIGGASRSKNVTFLLDGAKEGDIDAWVTLDQREMDVLEEDLEFLDFASMNPPIMIST
ncbi:hypothetical protein RJ639_034178 [Escallonia herrerae]|uniref:Uncharacterized protein n=1 Tax=Escallonia herrerae TaxID=1293975 RepID=A0AA89BIT0_9ASTE|nr:hypothetical protein RJ639_034178 [Escallonia herrerae]